MKIRSLAIKNVSSYRYRTSFEFDAGINILIGPNGGGKTNLQKIISLTLSKFFIHQYQFRRDDNVTSIEIVDPWKARALKQAFPKFAGDDSEQIIELELVPEGRDIENIRAIGANLDRFNKELSYWERRYDIYSPLRLVDRLADSAGFTYTIRDLTLEEPPADTPAWAFREYLREFFIFLRVVGQIPDVTLSSPVFFFSADRALSRSFEIQAGQLTEQAFFDGYRSAYHAATGGSMNLMQWGAQHFVRLHRSAVAKGAEAIGQTWREFFYESPDVALLTYYLGQLGYEWSFITDRDQLSYYFALIKDDQTLTTEMFSSGEREIVHFLLAMFALNVQDGLVLVDEPELHLHPRWQRIFLSLFRALAPQRNNQFIITTHSPAFVTSDTIDSVTRIFRGESGSRRVALRNVDLPEKRNLVRMINSQNNERLFFADKVILVEGISDRLVVESLVQLTAERFGVSASIEVLEVGGKHNFSDYRAVLTGLQTPTITVADRDYLSVVGNDRVRQLFSADFDKQWRTLTRDKKSADRAALLTIMESAIRANDCAELAKFWEYFSARVVALNREIGDEDSSEMTAEFRRLRSIGIYLLKLGEIEDYLPAGRRDVKGIVALLSDRHWINSVSDANARVELGEIVCAALDIVGDAQASFVRELAAGGVRFVAPPVGNSRLYSAHGRAV